MYLICKFVDKCLELLLEDHTFNSLLYIHDFHNMIHEDFNITYMQQITECNCNFYVRI